MARLFVSLLAALLCSASSSLAAPDVRSIPAAQPFNQAQLERAWIFPRDHGAHRDFQTEWWYFTGHLVGENKEIFVDPSDFGFQLTFFRRGLLTAQQNKPEEAEALLAHAALSEFGANDRFDFEKRYQRLGLGAGLVSDSTLNVALGGWVARLESLGESSGSEERTLRLSFSVKGAMVELEARYVGSPMFQGAGGFSKKGSCSTCASHYYSLPRLDLKGTVTRDGITARVHGIGWMDHEFMSSALSPGQVGWDWVSLMHRDGRNLMAFQLRSDDPRERVTNCLQFRAPSDYRKCDVSFAVNSRWRSPRTGARYPAQIELQLTFPPDHGAEGAPSTTEHVTISPLRADQELSDNSMAYYEGAVKDARGDWIGYLEMTGYDRPMKHRL